MFLFPRSIALYAIVDMQADCNLMGNKACLEQKGRSAPKEQTDFNRTNGKMAFLKSDMDE